MKSRNYKKKKIIFDKIKKNHKNFHFTGISEKTSNLNIKKWKNVGMPFFFPFLKALYNITRQKKYSL